MAVNIPASNPNSLVRVAGFLNPASNSTVMMWVKFGTVPASPAYNLAYLLVDDPFTYLQFVDIDAVTGTTKLELASFGFNVSTASSPVAGTWYHVAWVQSGTTQRFYVNGSFVGNYTLNRAAYVIGDEILGNDSFATGNLQIAYLREWQAALTATEIGTEMESALVVRTTNLFLDAPFTSNPNDISGNTRNYIEVGTITYTGTLDPLVENSGINESISTGTLPQTITLPAGFVGAAWYSYDVPAGEFIISVFAIAALSDNVDVFAFNGPTSAPVLITVTTNRALMVPVIPGTTIYIKIASDLPTSTAVTVSIIPGPSETVPVGAIFTNDEHTPFPTACVSAIDGDNYHIYRYLLPPDATLSENGGDVLANGKILLVDDHPNSLIVYNGQFVAQTTVANVVPATGGGIVRTSIGEQVWYAGAVKVGGVGAFDKTVRIDQTGTVTNVYATGGANGVAAKNDGSIIYVGIGGFAGAIKQFDTATNLFIADLVAGFVNEIIRDLLVLGDGSIIAIYSTAALTVNIRRFNAAGALLNTYIAGELSNAELSLFHALDDPTSFWTRIHPLNRSKYINIRVSDGVALATILQMTFHDGEYSDDVTLTPIARFGVAGSCPSFILREEILPPTPPVGTPGTITVVKVTVPASLEEFTINAGGGLVPATFTLVGPNSFSFEGVPAGSGYTILESGVPLYTTTYVVSNGSPINNITVADGETVIVTITNTKSLTGGIYKITPGKRFDTLWINFDSLITQDVKIPDPQFKTALLGN